MSGGFLGRAFGLGRALLLRGFGAGSGDAPVDLDRIPCLTISAPYGLVDVALSAPVGLVDLTIYAPRGIVDLTISAPQEC